MPLWLFFGDWGLFNGSPHPRGALSDYYYSGLRETFVAILAATGAFFVTYKVAEKNLDNTLSVVAGLSAFLIPIFPTARSSPAEPLNPIQSGMGEHTVQNIHRGASAAFLVSLMLLSYSFGRVKGNGHGGKACGARRASGAAITGYARPQCSQLLSGSCCRSQRSPLIAHCSSASGYQLGRSAPHGS